MKKEAKEALMVKLQRERAVVRAKINDNRYRMKALVQEQTLLLNQC